MHEYKVEVLRVVDGDTVDVDIDLGFSTWLKKQRIRLYGIDTPETRTRDLDEKKYGKMALTFYQMQSKMQRSLHYVHTKTRRVSMVEYSERLFVTE